MCGIAGFYRSNTLQVDDLKRMTHAIRHRGPDDEGFYFDARSGAGLGHRRLAIFDLSSKGKQPMTYRDSGLWIVFNGEIFNFIELRDELEQKKYRFHSDTDTEVILAAYLEWGIDAFAKFNGMWAIALYDHINQKMVLCRDRYGIKPLYYMDHGQLVFASEYKAFWAIREKIGTEWDLRGIKTALLSPETLESSGFTLLDKVRNLQPGHYLISDGQGISIHRWWNTFDHLIRVPLTLEEQAAQLRELLVDACRLRMRSDVPIGSTLSGGMDSSSVVAMINHNATKETGQKRIARNCHQCFIHSFPNTSQDETEYADSVVQKTCARGIHVLADTNDLLKNLDRIIYDFESIFPRIPDSWWRIYQTMRRNGVLVSLDGHGGDELFAGYTWYIQPAWKDTPLFSSDFRFLFGLWRSMIAHRSILSSLRNMLTDKRADTVFLSKSGCDIEPYNRVVAELPREWSALNTALYQDFHHSILPRILKNFDLMSMAHGVEVRMPFMDYRVVNYAFSLPPLSKVGQGYTKLVLRKAMRELLPEKVLCRKMKTPFNSPLDQWFPVLEEWIESTFEMRHLATELISIKRLKIYYHEMIRPGKFDRTGGNIFLKYIQAIRLVDLMGKPVTKQ